MVVCRDNMGAAYVSGTSFAAPWISRKLAYLIHVMGLSREIAKALLIDSAAGWNRKDDISHKIGYGVVPKHINDIIHSSNDEIRFIMTGAAEEYETYTYNLPVPIVDNAHPFYARATLVYFPQCNRNQGVDYTSTEMDIHFGRIVSKKGKATIDSLDNNQQSEEGLVTLYEENARKMYRKWDNVKHISEEIKDRRVPRKAYDSGMWGLSIKTKERLQSKKKETLPFGVVVTLKEMNGVNRINDFIKMCMARGWLVNRLDVENQLDVYVKAEEEIEFE
jgi:predicted DNA-binding WGR domain protein